MSLLDQMAASSRARAAAARASRPLAELRAACADLPAPRRPTLGRFDLIAEVKRAAPSAGVLAAPPGPRADFAIAQASAYAAAGASLISVLTEPDRFDGDLADLAAVATKVAVPAMRKDFLIDPYQAWEARAHGADAVLLIVRMLPGGMLDDLCAAATDAGLLVLLEAFDAEDLARIDTISRGWPASVPLWAGVNTRDLVTLAVDDRRLRDMAPHLPRHLPCVAESGMNTPADTAAAATLGYRLALVGTALMRAADPTALAAAMRSIP